VVARGFFCFIGGDYREFVRPRAPHAFVPGDVARTDGTIVGTHGGIGALTVGQRTGVGVATGERLYVLRLDPDTRAAVVGTRDEVATRTYRLRDVSFTAPVGAERFRTSAVLRYRGTPLAGWVSVRTDGATLDLDEPALVAPGQAVVWYEGDEVVGGGTVARAA